MFPKYGYIVTLLTYSQQCSAERYRKPYSYTTPCSSSFQCGTQKGSGWQCNYNNGFCERIKSSSSEIITDNWNYNVLPDGTMRSNQKPIIQKPSVYQRPFVPEVPEISSNGWQYNVAGGTMRSNQKPIIQKRPVYKLPVVPEEPEISANGWQYNVLPGGTMRSIQKPIIPVPEEPEISANGWQYNVRPDGTMRSNQKPLWQNGKK